MVFNACRYSDSKVTIVIKLAPGKCGCVILCDLVRCIVGRDQRSEGKLKTHTAMDEVKRCLGNIERFDDRVNAFITVLSDTALEEAQQADEEFAGGGGKGLLAGVPISVKDCIDVAGV